MRSQRFYKTEVGENSAKFTGNCLYQTLLTLAQMSSWEYFEIFRNTFFTELLPTTAFDFNSNFLLFQDIFVSEQIIICLIFRVNLGISKFMAPFPLGPHNFSTYNKCYWVKNYTCIKNAHGIYFIKHINYFRNMLQGSEYASVLNILGFYICPGSEYTRVLNMPLVLNMSEFWISQLSEYTKVLNMPLLLNLPGFWICQGYTGFWICLNMPDYIWLNMSGSVWICRNMRE